MKPLIKSCVFVSLLIPVLQTSAASLFQPVELGDQELAELRGRYVLPQGIVHFGINMVSQWQNSSGQMIGARVDLQVAQLAQVNLTITPLGDAGGDHAPLAGNGQLLGGAGLTQVQGISQSVRTAGDYNSGENQVEIRIRRDGGEPFPTNAHKWTGDQQFSNAAGSVNVSAVSGGLEMALLANHGQGSARQILGQGGIAQQANILGSTNQVRNLTTLTVAMRDQPLARQKLDCSLTYVGVIRPVGY